MFETSVLRGNGLFPEEAAGSFKYHLFSKSKLGLPRRRNFLSDVDSVIQLS